MEIHKHSCLNCGHNIKADDDLKKKWLGHPDDADQLKLNHYFCEIRKPLSRGPIIIRENCLGNKINCKSFYGKKEKIK